MDGEPDLWPPAPLLRSLLHGAMGVKQNTPQHGRDGPRFCSRYTVRHQMLLGSTCLVKVWRRPGCRWDLRSGSPSLWTCHDCHLPPWRKECSISRKILLSIVHHFWGLAKINKSLLSHLWSTLFPAAVLIHVLAASDASPGFLVCDALLPLVSFYVQKTHKWVTVA